MMLGKPRGLVAQVAELLCRFPGVGPKSAERMTQYLLSADAGYVHQLADLLHRLKDEIHPCQRCYNTSEEKLCAVCTDPRRDPQVLCVVEQPKDVMAIEKTGLYRGLYHVLGGRIAPLENCGPERLTIHALMQRVRDDGVREVILATNPTTEGDGTALYISNLLASTNVKVTRLARGLATGTGLEFVGKDVLADALEGRRAF